MIFQNTFWKIDCEKSSSSNFESIFKNQMQINVCLTLRVQIGFFRSSDFGPRSQGILKNILLLFFRCFIWKLKLRSKIQIKKDFSEYLARSDKNLVKTQNHTLESAGASSRPKSGKEARSARSARIHSATSQDRRKSQAGMGGVSGEEYQV